MSDPMDKSGKHFWAEEQSRYEMTLNTKLIQQFYWIIMISHSLALLVIGFLIWYLIYKPLAVVWIASMLFMYGLMFYQYRKISSQRLRVIETQAHAQTLTQATLIGSVTHVAGHPKLERDEKVVLATVGAELRIYRFDSETPVDVIPLTEVVNVHTVVYDDERVPHIEVVDSAAQALQVTFRRNGETYICLFNRMRRHRPIDWYHSIQKARYSDS
jgi:hypothetical protein